MPATKKAATEVRLVSVMAGPASASECAIALSIGQLARTACGEVTGSHLRGMTRRSFEEYGQRKQTSEQRSGRM
eukprot:7382896-Prymnesium_polylepis.1